MTEARFLISYTVDGKTLYYRKPTNELYNRDMILTHNVENATTFSSFTECVRHDQIFRMMYDRNLYGENLQVSYDKFMCEASYEYALRFDPAGLDVGLYYVVEDDEEKSFTTDIKHATLFPTHVAATGLLEKTLLSGETNLSRRLLGVFPYANLEQVYAYRVETNVVLLEKI